MAVGNTRETKHRDNGSTFNSGKTLINRRTLLTIIPLSDPTTYNMEKRGEFPRRIVLTSRHVALTPFCSWARLFSIQSVL